MTANKPVLVHRIITYLQPSMVSDEVEALVSQLNKDGYKKIKVIVHDPSTETYSNGQVETIHATTVLATLKDNIDIGFISPN